MYLSEILQEVDVKGLIQARVGYLKRAVDIGDQGHLPGLRTPLTVTLDIESYALT